MKLAEIVRVNVSTWDCDFKKYEFSACLKCAKKKQCDLIIGLIIKNMK